MPDWEKSMNIDEILLKQKTFFGLGKTLDINFRVKMLKKLYETIKTYETEICNALKADLGKSDFESFMCEVGLSLTEISYMIKHVKSFSKRRYVHSPFAQLVSVSFQKPSPYGNVLIMSPWNYPFLLSVEPLANAIAAGNTVVIKPSAYSPETAKIVKKIIDSCFSEEYVAVVTGGRNENAELLNKKFDMVFFTGSHNVGKEVLRHCAEFLTPAVLELGGKSPCIVDSSAKIKLAAKRIVFGKYLNCGQTCVAPDYILCEKSIKGEFIEEIICEIKKQYGENPFENSDYGRIVNEKHFDRLCELIDEEKTVFGGKFNKDRLQIEPTVMNEVTFDDKVMGEEIFGPILPIVTYEKFEDIFDILKDRPRPLALYIFSENKKHIQIILDRLSFGGGCINDVVIHLATSEMGFGGVGESGMGAYHGKAGFEAFSHTKSIVDKKTFFDMPMRYQPYNKNIYAKLLKLFLR